jgi:hypothetical protein
MELMESCGTLGLMHRHAEDQYGDEASMAYEPEGSHGCLCSGASHGGLQWLPFGVCHIQDMQTSRRAWSPSWIPWTHLVSELLGDVMTTHPVGPHHGSVWIHLQMQSWGW